MSDVIDVLSKNGPHNKKFDGLASQLTRSLYASQLGGLPVTKEVVRTMNIQHVLSIKEPQTGEPIAASMVMRYPNGQYRVCGVAVDSAHKRKGYGTAIMRRIEALLPSESRLCLGVDKDKEETQWLVDWYTTLGYERCSETHDEIIMAKFCSQKE
jgi:ribosomal protein S18 acetylase RimI-like enzyme